MEKIEFKQGTKKESKIASELIHTTAPDFFRALFGSEAIPVLQKLYKTPSSMFSYQYCKFIMVDGQHAGLILGYSGRGEFIRTLRSGLVILRHFRLKAPSVIIRSIRAEKKFINIKDDEFYISNIAVSPSFRKKGIGKKLLEHVYKESKNLGLKNLVLDVATKNEKAIGLYKNIGMEKHEKINATIKGEQFSFYIMKLPIK
ncbi:N-acetyltransferase [Proteinivorax tanatarense]|uniref:N-acetyltransferase n=1 Tax=Proteinivorax tanatarense TaxID=1260629 RepID=A0AAU7VKQ5_9FIRM